MSCETPLIARCSVDSFSPLVPFSGTMRDFERFRLVIIPVLSFDLGGELSQDLEYCGKNASALQKLPPKRNYN